MRINIIMVCMYLVESIWSHQKESRIYTYNSVIKPKDLGTLVLTVI